MLIITVVNFYPTHATFQDALFFDQSQSNMELEKYSSKELKYLFCSKHGSGFYVKVLGCIYHGVSSLVVLVTICRIPTIPSVYKNVNDSWLVMTSYDA